MSRKPGVRNKNGYWFSEAGDIGRYFGRVDVVSYSEAMARLWAALASEGGDRVLGFGVGGAVYANQRPNGQPPQVGRRSPALGVSSLVRSPTTPDATASTLNPPPLSTNTVAELRDRYLDWLRLHRSPALHRGAKRHLQRFCEACGGLHAVAIAGSHLEAFQDALRGAGHDPSYVKKHATTVRAMFNKGVSMGWLPQGFKPFASVEGIRLDPKPLLESDLPTDDEVKALLAHAKGDMGDIIAVYHATGARTHELIEACVGDYQPNARTLVLGRHKRSRTLREPISRTITLNADADAILARRCEGRLADAYIFPNRKGKPYTSVLLDDRFATVRKRAGVRSTITIYSFRHLWISEMLMAGVDVLLVARMAGTSVAMIERVYGHFRNQSYQEAQARLDRERATRGL